MYYGKSHPVKVIFHTLLICWRDYILVITKQEASEIYIDGENATCFPDVSKIEAVIVI